MGTVVALAVLALFLLAVPARAGVVPGVGAMWAAPLGMLSKWLCLVLLPAAASQR